MNENEASDALEAYIKWGVEPGTNRPHRSPSLREAWLAACAWQREQDQKALADARDEAYNECADICIDKAKHLHETRGQGIEWSICEGLGQRFRQLAEMRKRAYLAAAHPEGET